MVVGVLVFGLLSTPGVHAQFVGSVIESLDTDGGHMDMGESTFTQQHANGFIAYTPPEDFYACAIDLKIGKNGTPTDGVRVQVHEYSSGFNPVAGTELTSSGIIPADDMLGTTGWTTFWFSSCVEFSTSELYAVYINRSSTESDSNFYEVYNISGATENQHVVFTAGAWALVSPAHQVAFRFRGIPSSFSNFTIETSGLSTTSLTATTTPVPFSEFFNQASTTFTHRSCPSVEGFWDATAVEAFFCESYNNVIDVFKVIFVVPEETLDSFGETINSFRTVFPFQIVFSVLDELNEVANNIDGTQEDITFPSVSMTGQDFPEVTVVSSTTFDTLFGSDLYTTFRDIETAIIWGSVGFLILFTVIKTNSSEE